MASQVEEVIVDSDMLDSQHGGPDSYQEFLDRGTGRHKSCCQCRPCGLGPGQFFGELAALDNRPRSANVVALENTTVATLTHETFREHLMQHPEVALRIMVQMARVIRASTERIMDLSTLGANNRVHAELLRLAKPGIRDDQTAVIRTIPIHGDIASRVSTTRETVARVFGDLYRNDLVKREVDCLIILDVERLTDMV